MDSAYVSVVDLSHDLIFVAAAPTFRTVVVILNLSFQQGFFPLSIKVTYFFKKEKRLY